MLICSDLLNGRWNNFCVNKVSLSLWSFGKPETVEPMHKYQLLKLVFLLAFCPLLTWGQSHSDAKWAKYIQYLNTAYNDLPASILDEATRYLDSTALTDHCYKFIPSSDSNKFIAFYLTSANPADQPLLKKEFGGTSHHIDLFAASPGSETTVMAYTVCGTRYNNEWYYHKSDYYEFTAPDIESARTRFLMETLLEKDFFAFASFATRDKENKKFWSKNGFEKCTNPAKAQKEETPTLVSMASAEKKQRTEDILNSMVEQTAFRCYTNLWSVLHDADSVTYRKPLYSDACISWYNPQRNMVLLPVVFYDHKNKPWVLYFVLKITKDSRNYYLWKRIPRKPMDWPKGNEVQQLVYDIRGYLPNWSWGSTNMIADKQFWSDNFKDEDLRLVVME